jgi:hypothetical protein
LFALRFLDFVSKIETNRPNEWIATIKNKIPDEQIGAHGLGQAHAEGKD